MEEVKRMEMKMIMVVSLMVALLVPAVIIVAAQNPGAPDIPEGPEYGRDAALAYVLANYPELGDLGDPSKIRTPWHEESLTPEGWVGSNAVQYTKGG
jgi:hypothetical protein